MLYVWLTSSTNTNMYVYEGTDRKNTSIAIQSDMPMNLGAPIKMPISNGAVIVLQIS